MMRPMRSNHAQEDPIEGFDTAGLPPMGPEGIPGAHDRKLAPPPPRLCEAGPCRNYHRFEIQLDVEGPKAAAIEPGGKMIGAPPKQPFHVRVHHYCYPTTGVETELGSLPVMKCNRWDPIDAAEVTAIDARHEQFFQSEAGRRYVAELGQWQADRDAEAALEDLEGDELATWITLNVRDGDSVYVCDPKQRNEAGEAKELERLDADTARAFVSLGYLRERHGAGAYLIEIVRPTDPPEIVNISVEVK
jgi:hypothetical protein